MPTFDVKKNLEDGIKGGIVITRTAAGIFGLLKVARIASPPKPALDLPDLIKLSGGIITAAFVNSYVIYKKWM